jgi:hypothetical protein
MTALGFHRKEGVDGSSPSEGFIEVRETPPAAGFFHFCALSAARAVAWAG